MNEIINHISSDKLTTALETNLAAFWSVYGCGKSGFLQSTPNIVLFYSGIHIALFNGVVYVKLRINEIKPTVDNLQSKIDTKGAPAMWWLGPSSKPENLGALLEFHGLHSAGDSPGMAIELVDIPYMPNTIENFFIQEVINKEMQEL